jgi:CBS domain containing-hemolysin-like protein
MTESELLAFTDVAVEEAAIESDERELIHSILEFGDTIVREVMVPRPDIVAFEAATLAESALEEAIAAGFSRLPVYDANMDNIVGIAFTKDLVLAVRRGQAGRPVGEIARAPHFVPETKRVAPLLREMQRGRFHLAVVVDEYGGTAGIVSLEDLIEELVGEISDEYDVAEPTIEALEAGRYRVPAILGVDEVNDFLGAELPLGDDWDTIGGLVLAQAGRIPSEGESIDVDGYRLVAGNVEGQRIGWVTVEALEERPPLHLEEVVPADSSSRPIGGSVPGGSVEVVAGGGGDGGGGTAGGQAAESAGSGGGTAGGQAADGGGGGGGDDGGGAAGGREPDSAAGAGDGDSTAGNPGADAGSSSGVRS